MQGRIVFSSVLLLATASLLSLSGCSVATGDTPSSSGAGVTLRGAAFGGQQPVNGGTVQLYSAPSSGTASTGYAQAATPLISATVKTAADGSFSITNDYTCPGSPNDQVYLTVTGGDAGSGTNNNLALMAALGPCGSLSSSTFININEVTTVASAYALSGFATDATHVGTSSTNYTGLKNAFATVNNLVNTTTGAALTKTPAYQTQATGTIPVTFTSVVPQSEINTLGNILSACVNSAGGSAGDGTACGNLFTSTTVGTSVPTDTIQAALSIAHNPGHNGGAYNSGSNPYALFALQPTTPPFTPYLTTAPSDWIIGLNFIGGGLGGSASSSYAVVQDLAIDASGNIWTTDYHTNRLTELSNLGAPISPSTTYSTVSGTTGSGTVTKGGFAGGGLNAPTSIAIDLSGNVWIGNNGAAQISKFNTAGTAVSGSPFTGGGLTNTNPSIAVDGYGNVWVSSTTAIAEFDGSGNALSGTSGYGSSTISATTALAVDGSENIWIASPGNRYAFKLNNSGSILVHSGGYITSSVPEAAIDASGSFWLPEAQDYRLIGWASDMTPDAGNTINFNNTDNPLGVVLDGGDKLWTVRTTNVMEADPVTQLVISPTVSGYSGVSTSGTNQLFNSPVATAVDSSGNFWFANSSYVSTVTEFVGMATPTITPKVQAVKNNTIGQRP